MIDPAVIAALTVVAGATAALTVRDGRLVVLCLMFAAVAASLVADPLPDSLSVAARILGAMLAASLLWAIAGSGSVRSPGSGIGPLAEAAAATAAFAIGLQLRPVDPLTGPVVAQAAGLALVTLALAPLAGRDVFRLGVAVTILALGGSLLLGAWNGPLPPLAQLSMALLIAGIAAATGLLVPTAAVAALDGARDVPAEEPDAIDAPQEQPVVAMPLTAAPEGHESFESVRTTRRPRSTTGLAEWATDGWDPEGLPRTDAGNADDRSAELEPGPAGRGSAEPKPAAAPKRTHTRPNLKGKP
jgi:hypothetical protein